MVDSYGAYTNVKISTSIFNFSTVGSIFPHAMEDAVLIVGIIQHYFKRQVNTKGDVALPPAHQSCSKSLYYCREKRKISRNSPTPPKQTKPRRLSELI